MSMIHLFLNEEQHKKLDEEAKKSKASFRYHCLYKLGAIDRKRLTEHKKERKAKLERCKPKANSL